MLVTRGPPGSYTIMSIKFLSIALHLRKATIRDDDDDDDDARVE